ncbi:MAG: ATP-binding protein [Candidatus Saccharimonadia bacterium]
MSWFSINLIIPFTEISIVAISLMAWLRNRNSRGARAFFIASFIFSFWTTANYYSLLPGNLSLATFATRLSYAGGLWLLIALCVFSHYFPLENKLSLKQYVMYGLITIGGGWLSISNLVARQVNYTNHQFMIVPGPGYILYGILALLLFALALDNFHQNYQVANLVEKNQIRYASFGIAITFLTGIILNFVLVLVNPNLGGPLIDCPAALLAVAFIGYGLIRHRYADIHLIITKLITYLLGFGIIAVLLLGTSWELGRIYPHSLSTLVFGIAGAAFILLIILQPLFQAIEHWSAYFFDPGWYESPEVLRNLGTRIAEELHLKPLLSNTLSSLCREIGVTFGQVSILNSDSNGISEVVGDHPKKLIAAIELKKIKLKHSFLLTDELALDDPLRASLEEYGIQLLLPLKTRGEFVGYLLLGVKQTGDIFSAQDISVLQIIASQLAVAIVGAQAYEEIGNFNATLQERIDRATKNLRDAHEALRADDQMKTEFIALASHNLRTPLTIINGEAELLGLTKLGHDQVELLESLRMAGKRLNKLVEDLLTISAIESGAKPTMQQLRASDILLPLIVDAKKQANASNLSLIVKETSPDATVNGNLPRIQTALRNVIENAFKFTKVGKITIEQSVRDDKLVISISDTGSGIAKKELPSLFNKFHRATNFMHYDYEGAGLSLFLTDLIIKEHDGKITVKSEVEKGSTFSIEIPLIRPTQPTAPKLIR